MNDRDRLFRKCRRTNREVDWSTYRRKKNRVNNLINSAKTKYNQKILEENASNPDKFWKAIKQVFPSKPSNKSCSMFQINGQKTFDKSNIANGFCNFFASVANTLKSKSIFLRDFIWSKPIVDRYSANCTFKLRPVSVAEVQRYLKQLKRNKSVGLDSLPSGFLKDIARVIAKPLCHIINLSLQSGIVPKDFKEAKVIPIHKSGNSCNIDNYRPISVLPVISKILEKCVNNQLMQHLENHKLLSDFQFGFRPKRSTELAATLFVDNIRANMDKGELTGVVYIDLSKAFDTISHSSIISKLPAYGITGIEQKWFIDYLFARSQTVYYDNVASNKQPVYCGVPQGSILGPSLFLMHFNGICSILKLSVPS